MNFEGFTVAQKTTLQEIKELDEKRAKLLETGKTDALTKAEEALNELTALGFEYELTEVGNNASLQERRV